MQRLTNFFKKFFKKIRQNTFFTDKMYTFVKDKRCNKPPFYPK